MSYLGYCPEVSAVRVPWFRCVRCPFGPLREGPTSRRARTCLWTRLCNTPASAHRRSSWPCPGSVWKKARQVLTLDYRASCPEQTKLIQGNTAKAGKPKRIFFFFLQTQLSRWLWCCSTATARMHHITTFQIDTSNKLQCYERRYAQQFGENTYAEKIHPLTF